MNISKRSISLMVLLFLMSAAMIPSGNGWVGESRHRINALDRDGDGIDDRITEGEVNYPVWTFVHVSSHDRINDVSSRIARTGAVVRRSYDLVPVISVLFGSREDVNTVSRIPRVDLVEVQVSVIPIMNISTKAIKANPSEEYSPRTARDIGMTGKGITIAIIDTGVDNEHPTFDGAFVAGVDFTMPVNTPLNPADGSFDPDDRSGHGTGVASIALGRGDADGKYRGVAPDAGLIDLKVIGMSSFTLNQNSLMDALQWCADNQNTSWGDTGYKGVDIVSMSLSTGNDGGAVTRAMDGLVDRGIVVVQGAGNTGAQYGSGSAWADRSIVVGAVDDQRTVNRDDDTYWSSSTYGPRTDDGDSDIYDELRPDVVAPGVSITFASSSRTSKLKGANGWSSGSGTSYSTPHVSGTVALMLQAKSTIRPDRNHNPVTRILHQTSEPRGNPYDSSLSPVYNVNYGFGILDAYESVKASLTYTAVNHRPEITYFAVEPNVTTSGSQCRIRAVAVDIDEEPLNYDLKVDDGTVSGEGPLWDWEAPQEPGKYYFNLAVTDPHGGKDTASTFVIVNEGLPNRPPVITSFKAGKNPLTVGSNTSLKVAAIDQDGDDLTFDYDAERGDISGVGDEVLYHAPAEPAKDRVTVTVSDGKGGTDSRSIVMDIRSQTENSLPVLTLITIEPGIIGSNNSGVRPVLFAQVADPDGLDDISVVMADLRALGGDPEVELKNDGVPPDVQAGDLEFSLLLPPVSDLANGTYTIRVTVIDLAGSSDTGTVPLIVAIPGNSTVVKGSGSGIGSGTVVILTIIILFVVLVVIGFFIARSRSGGTAQGQNETLQGGYRSAVPVQQPQERLRPVDRR